MAASTSPWPEGYRAAISVTLDNMGEAAAIQRGEWPAGARVGAHPSVTQVLPNLLDLLDDLDVRATYFIEAWNTRVYPDAIREVSSRGHEVAVHGWCHEPWRGLQPEEEAEMIVRSVDAFDRLGIDVCGFRPPGGVLTEQSPSLLRSSGITHCSPAGARAAFSNGMTYLPFEWQAIDAYYYLPAFAGLRETKGDPGDTLAPSDLAERVSRYIDDRIDTGGYLAILFHPFLEGEPERIAAMVEVIRRVTDDEDVWCAPCREIASWIEMRTDSFPDDPGFDATGWTRG